MNKTVQYLMSFALCVLLAIGCVHAQGAAAYADEADGNFIYTEYLLERNGIALHLDCMKENNSETEAHILLVHCSTFSSHEFDINYEDYSLVRRLAREGYAVWRLDIAGYGQSDEVTDGLMPDIMNCFIIHLAVGIIPAAFFVHDGFCLLDTE